MRALAAGGGAADRRRFHEALLRAQLIIPSPGLQATGLPMNAAVRTDQEVNLNLIGVEAPDGGRAMLGFTSEAALLAWRPVGCPYLSMPVPEALAMALGAGFGSLVINPRGPAGGWIPEAELRALAEGKVPAGTVEEMRIPAGRSFALGRPARPVPAELQQALLAAVEPRAEVRAAWILQVAIGGEDPHLCVILESTPGTVPGEFVPAIMETVQVVVPDGECVDCVAQPPGGEFVATARQTSPPLFTRS
jgi:hypothetical protein